MDSGAGENVADLSDSGCFDPVFRQPVQNGLRWFEREIMTVFGSLVVAGSPDERTGDDPANSLAVGNLPALTTNAIEFLQRDDLFVRRDLDHGIGAGVEDRFAGGDMFFTEFLIRITAEGSRPLYFFLSGWNVFDFGCLLISYDGPGSPLDHAFPGLRIVRVIRLLYVTTKHPVLVGVLNSWLEGFKCLLYLIPMWLLCFYLYAIVGCSLFAVYDPGIVIT